MEEGVSGLDRILETFRLEQVDPTGYSPLVLAWLGDAVYEVIVRTKLTCAGNMQVNKLHRHSASLVRAGAQAQLMEDVREMLTEEELAVYRRGRNAKSATTAKNATIADYRKATGFEALVGWLYLSGRLERILELVEAGFAKEGEL